MIICIHQRYFVQRVYPIEFVNRSVGILQGGEGGWVGDHRGDPRTARSAKLLRWKFTWRYIDLKLLFAVDLKYTFTSKNLLPVFNIFYLVLFQSVLDASVTKGRLMCSTQCSLSENFLKWDISGETRVFIFTKCNFWNREKNFNDKYDHDEWGRKQGDIKHKDAVDELISSAPGAKSTIHREWNVLYQLCTSCKCCNVVLRPTW